MVPNPMLSMFSAVVLLLVLLCREVRAHGGALNYTVGDTWYPGYDPDGDYVMQDSASWMVQRKWVTVDPIFETTNQSLSCNAPGTPAHAYIPIDAGEDISAVYMYWVHTVGPMIAWLARCDNFHNDCTTFDSSKADWFKIGQKGLQGGTVQTGDWFQRTFSRWDGSPSLWTETIPKNIKPGRYLLRHEIISLHSANKPQFYPECVHIDIKGTGTKLPGKGSEYMAKIPGVWSMSQPEINIDIYQPDIGSSTVYNIPGPPVWTGED